jgi:prolyl oligopeptidase
MRMPSGSRWLLLLGLAAAGCATQRAATPLRYPAAPMASVVDHYHGVAVPDPYRPLEQLDAPATRRWVAAENRLARPWLESLPLRAALRRDLDGLMRYARRALPVVEGGRSFGLRHDGRQAQSVLYVATGDADPGRVLIDPAVLRKDGTVAIDDFVPDPQGRRVAYALSDAGSDWKSWHIRDVDSGRDLDEVLRFTKFTSVSWARDGSGFYYSRYPARADGSGDDQRQASIWYHRIGSAQAADRFVYAITDHPTRDPYGEVSEDGRWLIVTQSEGTLTSGLVALSLEDPQAPARPLATDRDGLYTYIGARGDTLYFTTTAGAPNGRVLALDIAHPERARWRTVVPEAGAALLQATLVGGRVFALYLEDAHSVVRLYREDGTPAGEVPLPGLGTVAGFQGHLDDAVTYFSYTDYFTPLRILGYDIASGTAHTLFAPAVSVDTTRYVSEQVFFPSRDGTRIPMFLVHRRELARDGNQPVLLYGYGGFDIALTPAYSAGALAWLELGGMYAVANLRGGGEYGGAWHEAGIRGRKQNVFDDFAAAARYLVDAGYTRPQRIAISGRSNGGLLVGASLTQHPELFGAALPAVGVLDMLRYHTASANARQWSSDYGLSEDPADFAAQRAYSPLHNVRAGTCYPPTLITTADHDDRVVPWHSYKFAATLQRAQGCANPVLIRIETRAGHGAGKPLWMQIEDLADQWAFAAQALGMQAAPHAGGG